MPVYVYRCEGCGAQFERRQSFSDAPLTECDACHGLLRKVFQPATVIYRGSGFYSTDYRSRSGGNGRNGDSSSAGGREGKGESSSSLSKASGESSASASDD